MVKVTRDNKTYIYPFLQTEAEISQFEPHICCDDKGTLLYLNLTITQDMWLQLREAMEEIFPPPVVDSDTSASPNSWNLAWGNVFGTPKIP